uniref:FP protein C-terminal domain-containing protein n=2 Tax=Cacopsylla melanoneura TaxID=428564 RepID=A0A8D8Z9A5_9HEMI
MPLTRGGKGSNATQRVTQTKKGRPAKQIPESKTPLWASEDDDDDEDEMPVKFVQEMRQMLNNFKREIRTELKEFEQCLTFNSEKMEEMMTKMDGIQDSLKKITVRQQKLEEKNKELEKTLMKVEQRNEELEQYTRNKNIQLDGIPKLETENLEEIMKEIGKKIEVPIENKDIDVIHRIPTRSTTAPEPIVVQFLTRKMRDNIVQKAKTSRISTKDLKMNCTERPIFINEHLTPLRKQILFEARKLKTDQNYKFLWVKGCKIFIRKTETSPVIQLNCMEDLKKIE